MHPVSTTRWLVLHLWCSYWEWHGFVALNRPQTWSRSELRLNSSLRSWRTGEKRLLQWRCFRPRLWQRKQGVTLLKNIYIYMHFHASFQPCVDLKAQQFPFFHPHHFTTKSILTSINLSYSSSKNRTAKFTKLIKGPECQICQDVA